MLYLIVLFTIERPKISQGPGELEFSAENYGSPRTFSLLPGDQAIYISKYMCPTKATEVVLMTGEQRGTAPQWIFIIYCGSAR